MILYIDTTGFGEVVFELKTADMNIKKSFPINPAESYKMLSYLDKFLKQTKVKNFQTEIKGLVLFTGEGSFTGLRVGGAVAQALSLYFGVPIQRLRKA